MASHKNKKSLQQVSMSNALVRAAHRLRITEKRLITLGIANTDQIGPIPRNSGWMVRIHASEYAEQFGVDVDAAYKALSAASKKLYQREITSVWQIKQVYDDEVEFNFRWVSSVKYYKNEGCVDLNFTPEIVPHLIDLKKKFTSYKMESTAHFKSLYAWRLYEVLLSYESQQNEKEFEIYEFWLTMEAPASCIKDFGAMRRVVINPAVKEINATSDLKILELSKDKKGNPVYFEAIKKGRKVAGVRFKFKKDEQIKMELPKTKRAKAYTRSDLDKDSSLARPGESYEQALKRLNSNRS